MFPVCEILWLTLEKLGLHDLKGWFGPAEKPGEEDKKSQIFFSDSLLFHPKGVSFTEDKVRTEDASQRELSPVIVHDDRGYVIAHVIAKLV